MVRITRRQFVRTLGRAGLGAVLAGLAGPLGCRPAARRLETLLIQAPPSPPSLALLRLAQQGVPADLAQDLDFRLWSTADEMRARITSGQAHFSGLPVNVATTLYNRGIGLQLLDVYIWGILYLISSNPQVRGWEDLRGETVLIPFRGDLPDILTQYLLHRQGLELGKDIQPQYLSTAPEAAQLLAAGRARHAVLSEPSATLAVLKAQEGQVSLHRVIDYSQAWAEATGRAARIPMAGVVATSSLMREHPRLIAWFQQAHSKATSWVAENPDDAVQMGADEIEAIPPRAMRESISHIKAEVVEAGQAREEIEFFLSEMYSLSPGLIGGRLPPDEFYYHA